MKKTLLVVCAIFLSAGVFAADIPFDQYGNVQLSDFENYADNQKVTVTLSVSNANSSVAPGWGIGTIKPINYSGSNAAPYDFVCKAASSEGAENVYEFTIADFKDYAKENGVYYVDQYSQSGITINVYNGATLVSIVVSAAVIPLVPSTSLDFEGDEIDDAYPSAYRWANNDVVATVEPDPTGASEKSLHVIVTNYNAYPRFTVELPDGKTLADIEKITFNIYFMPGFGDQNQYKRVNCYIGPEGTSFSTTVDPPVSVNNLILNDATGTWLLKEIPLSELLSDDGLLALNTFDMALGFSYNNSNFYLDNIKFLSQSTGINIPSITDSYYYSNNTLYLNVVGTAQIYDVNGRLLISRQNVSTIDLSNLANGIYIAKIIAGGQTETVKIAK
ncbi:MAG: T9SS type A sorting domain-containing protein [Candidatus Azobacteroides sp.]|nr:T9SS type A sorting domain-containing protein [Candidatus Azobacteroides sp.]